MRYPDTLIILTSAFQFLRCVLYLHFYWRFLFSLLLPTSMSKWLTLPRRAGWVNTTAATHRQHVQLCDPVLIHGEGEWDAVLNCHHHGGNIMLHHTTLITLLFLWFQETKHCVFSNHFTVHCSMQGEELFHVFQSNLNYSRFVLFVYFHVIYLTNAHIWVNVATSVRPTVDGHTAKAACKYHIKLGYKKHC